MARRAARPAAGRRRSAFVTGCQMAHVTALAAARHAVLARAGWDVERDGLVGRAAASASSRARSGTSRSTARCGCSASATAAVASVEADDQGRMRADALGASARRGATGPTIVCAQAGDVNTGAFDPLDGDRATSAHRARRVGARRRRVRAVGGRVARSSRHLVAGAERADSWATDAHKWLNVPYDCGIALLRAPRGAPRGDGRHARATSIHGRRTASATRSTGRPEFSRRARGFAVYAALRSLGRSGVAELVERCCAHARRFAERLGGAPGRRGAERRRAEPGAGPVRARRTATTARARDRARCSESGTCWLSGTTWDGRAAMRISVSNWPTDEADVERDRRRRSSAAVTPPRLTIASLAGSRRLGGTGAMSQSTSTPSRRPRMNAAKPPSGAWIGEPVARAVARRCGSVGHTRRDGDESARADGRSPRARARSRTSARPRGRRRRRCVHGGRAGRPGYLLARRAPSLDERSSSRATRMLMSPSGPKDRPRRLRQGAGVRPWRRITAPIARGRAGRRPRRRATAATSRK